VVFSGTDGPVSVGPGTDIPVSVVIPCETDCVMILQKCHSKKSKFADGVEV